MPVWAAINRPADCSFLSSLDDVLPAVVFYAEPDNLKAANTYAAVRHGACGRAPFELFALDSAGKSLGVRAGKVSTGGGTWEIAATAAGTDAGVAWLSVNEGEQRGSVLATVPPAKRGMDVHAPEFAGDELRWSARSHPAGERLVQVRLPRVVDDYSRDFLLFAWEGAAFAGGQPDGITRVNGKDPTFVLAAGAETRFWVALMDSAGNVSVPRSFALDGAAGSGSTPLEGLEASAEAGHVEQILALQARDAPELQPAVACGPWPEPNADAHTLLRRGRSAFPSNSRFILPRAPGGSDPSALAIELDGARRPVNVTALHTGTGPFVLVEPVEPLPTTGRFELVRVVAGETALRGELGSPDDSPPTRPRRVRFAVLDTSDPMFFFGKRLLLQIEGVRDEVWRTLRAEAWIGEEGKPLNVAAPAWSVALVEASAGTAYAWLGALNVCDPRAPGLATFGADRVTVGLRFVDGAGNASALVSFVVDLSRTVNPNRPGEQWRRAMLRRAPVSLAEP